MSQMNDNDKEGEGEEEYPSIREALFGNGKKANLRCALKYTLWKAIYVTIAAVILTGAAFVRLYRGVIEPFGISTKRVLGPPIVWTGRKVLTVAEFLHVGDLAEAIGLAVATSLHAVFIRFPKWTWTHIQDKSLRGGSWLRQGRTGQAGYFIGLAIASPFVIVFGGLKLVNDRTGFFTGIASLIDWLLDVVVSFLSGSAKTAGSSAKQLSDGTVQKVKDMEDKPGTQRIYGYCPVSFDIKPKWFTDSLGIDFYVEEDEWGEKSFHVDLDDAII